MTMRPLARGWLGGGPRIRPPRWRALCALPAIAALAGVGTSGLWDGQLLLPLLAVPPALAGIGAATPRRPLSYGAVMLLASLVTVPFAATPQLPAVTAVAVVAVTAISVAGAARSGQQNQRLADVTSVAEAAQRALLRPLPGQIGSLELGVVYLAAAAEARVGGDLYEVARTQFGIRLIVGDVRGKGLDAVELAADVLGVFREVAHEVYTLAEVARRLDASLARRPAAPLEEFVTAVLAEIDPATGSLTIYNCGHPPPLVLSQGSGEPDPASRLPAASRLPTASRLPAASHLPTASRLPAASHLLTANPLPAASPLPTAGHLPTPHRADGEGGRTSDDNGDAGNAAGDGGVSRAGLPSRVTTVDVPSSALPLRLMALGDCSGAERTLPLRPGDVLLLYTDGVTEARNSRREFYPLAERVAMLAAVANGSPADLLRRLRDDLLRHVGAPLTDDAALLLVRAPRAWEGRGQQALEAAAR